MCGSCEPGPHAGVARWTGAHLIVLALVAALVALSFAGLALRLESGASTTGCWHVADDSTAYQATVTRDLEAGSVVLVADTNAFVEHVRKERTTGCAQLRRFVSEARLTLDSVCAPCSDRVRRAVDQGA